MSIGVSQISYEKIQMDKAAELLAVAPFNIKVSDKPVIYWTCPQGLAKGSDIVYTIVKGFNVIKINGIIESFNNDKIMAKTVDTRCGNWICEHSIFPDNNNSTVVFCDKININDFSEVFFNEMSVKYYFEERKSMKIIMAETRKMQALNEQIV